MDRVAIVTVTFNSENVIEDFMNCFMQLSGDVKLFVVDNRSMDRTLSIIKEFGLPNVEIFALDTNTGVAAGNNVGIDMAILEGFKFTLLLNNDTVFSRDLVVKLLDEMKSTGHSLSSPKIMFYEPRDRIWCAGGKFTKWRGYATQHTGEGQIDIGQYNISREVEYVPTCCLLVDNQIFKENGVFDDKYFVYHDDSDFIFRIGRSKINIWYNSSVKIYHKVSSLTGGGESDFSLRYGTRNKIYFLRKNLHPLKASFFVCLYAFFSILKSFKLEPKKRKIIFKALIEGFRL